jgi:hypothetical protein
MGVGGLMLMSIVWLALALLIVWAVAQVFPRRLTQSEIRRDTQHGRPRR